MSVQTKRFVDENDRRIRLMATCRHESNHIICGPAPLNPAVHGTSAHIPWYNEGTIFRNKLPNWWAHFALASAPFTIPERVSEQIRDDAGGRCATLFVYPALMNVAEDGHAH